MWPDNYCHAICHDSVVWQTKAQGTNLGWWPDNHYPIICFSSIVWPDQHNHGMCHNSIILQTIKVNNSGWFDHIITIMLSFTTIFCNKHRRKRPLRKVWNAKDSNEWLTHIRVTTSSCCLSWRYCITNRSMGYHYLHLTLVWPGHHYPIICHDGTKYQTQENMGSGHYRCNHVVCHNSPAWQTLG